ncbi:MAG TPA: nickel pincer cofactor biosynthesis protein LarC [Actinomycetota bacterium]|nr:nickel pincer cofactor biosynthesis protein LarC [Actinomycetota bacterium]
MTILYFDCFSGAAGDMILGALLDAGVPLDVVRRAVDGLGVDGWQLDATTVRKGPLRATKAVVTVRDARDTSGRTYRELADTVASARLDDAVRARALDVFRVLAEAEARVHGVALGDVHLHEAGALDALVDVVGASAALAHLAPARVVVSPVATGTGTIETEHGPLPLPAPAAAEILTGAVLYGRGERELVTPTGAAILASAADEFGPLPRMRVRAIGYGAGDAELDHPNVVRVLVGDDDRASGADDAHVVEANLDDHHPETIPVVIDELLAAGAQDAWATPIVMKKGRPALTLSALVAPEHADDVVELMFRHTTTLGVRRVTVHKDALERSFFDVDVFGQRVRVKVGWLRGDAVTRSPEHDDVVAAARATGRTVKDVHAEAVRRAQAHDLPRGSSS